MKVTKIKIKNDTPVITYDELHEDGKTSEVQHSGCYLIHEDLKAAMDRLVPHLAVVCDMRESDHLDGDIENYHEETFSHIHVTAVSIAGEGDHEGVCLIGYKKIGKKTMNITSPFTKFHDEIDPYRFSAELVERVQAVQYEACEYLGGKHAIGQTEIEFEEHGEDLD